MRPGRAIGEQAERGAGAATGRGVLLLAIALIVGVLALNAVDEPAPQRVATNKTEDPAVDGGDTPTTAAPAVTSTTKPLAAPGDIILLVANASGVNKAGAKVKAQLDPAGYNQLAPTTADKVKDLQVSEVHFAPEFAREAEEVAKLLQLPPTSVKPLATPPPVKDPKGAKIIVLVGMDLANRPAAPAPATTARGATSSSTTARAGATTTTAARGASSSTRP